MKTWEGEDRRERTEDKAFPSTLASNYHESLICEHRDLVSHSPSTPRH